MFATLTDVGPTGQATANHDEPQRASMQPTDMHNQAHAGAAMENNYLQFDPHADPFQAFSLPDTPDPLYWDTVGLDGLVNMFQSGQGQMEPFWPMDVPFPQQHR